MDVSLSVASAVEKTVNLDPRVTAARLWRSGINVGRDVIGMMSSTLILAYIGGDVPLFVIIAAWNTPALKILNSDMVVTETVRSLAGAIGLGAAVPLTVSVATSLAISRRCQMEPPETSSISGGQRFS